jgi:hypothetical protein
MVFHFTFSYVPFSPLDEDIVILNQKEKKPRIQTEISQDFSESLQVIFEGKI